METKNKVSYKAPVVELLKFENSDIITTSGFFGAEDEFPVGTNVQGTYSDSSELPDDPGAGR